MLRRLVLFLLCCSLTGFAQTKRPFTFEDMMQLKRIGEPIVSPDGKWVAFSAVDVSLDANTKTPHLWIVPIAGGDAKRLTPESGSGEDRIRFAPDGTVLDTTSFPISAAAGDQVAPLVVFDGTNWIVVWSDARDGAGSSGTRGARVAQDGTVLDPQGFIIESGTAPSGSHVPAGLDLDGAHVVVSVNRPSCRRKSRTGSRPRR